MVSMMSLLNASSTLMMWRLLEVDRPLSRDVRECGTDKGPDASWDCHFNTENKMDHSSSMSRLARLR
jgi:hypothetical protein